MTIRVPNGNTDILRGIGLIYDAENRLTSYNGTILTAGYNGNGLRTWKQTVNSRTYFLYDRYGPVCELDSSGNVSAPITASPGGLISRRVSAASTFYTFDPQGNTYNRLDASGNVLSSDLYDGYGNRIQGSATDPYGYGAMWGYYTDHETGLLLCTFRYYDPQNGRWLTRDPLGYTGGIDLYGYVRNNPVTRADPEGLVYYGNYCGSGRRGFPGWPKPEEGNDMDTCCYAHDRAWDADDHLTFWEDTGECRNQCYAGCFTAKCYKATKADKDLCNCAKTVHCGIWDRCIDVKLAINLLFCYSCGPFPDIPTDPCVTQQLSVSLL